MEKSRQRELETQVTAQKEQLSRYEKRLKDVVCAYKGLLKEKEALETSLTAISTRKELEKDGTDSNNAEIAEGISSSPSPSSSNTVPCDSADEKSQLQTQILTLMNSLATLSAEKSRMEASFQSDKKLLRTQLGEKDHQIGELKAMLKKNAEKAKAEVEEVRAKWICERQEREKETNNQMLMIRELQKLYADERHLKENIEMQLNNLKTQLVSKEVEDTRLNELHAQLKETKAQLKQLQAGQKDSRLEASDNAAELLKQVQQEMRQLKDQHAIAIRKEQRRVSLAEDQSRKQAALHENRIASLEAKLAELSNTYSMLSNAYDRLRQQDQENIQTLKEKMHDIEMKREVTTRIDDSPSMQERKRSLKDSDITSIIHEISRLKKLLIVENENLQTPIDLSKVFSIHGDHMQENLWRAESERESAHKEIDQLKEKLQIQKSHISTLQEKVKVLNRNIDDQELELKQHSDKLRQAVMEERTKWKTSLSELENEHRCRISDLEQQLQKQRQRSLQLLDEKEQEIKTLQTSFDVFQNATLPGSTLPPNEHAANSDPHANSSDCESLDDNNKKVALRTKKLSVIENCHMLHYANELARKDIEITSLRKAKYTAEVSLRKAIQDKVTAQEEFCDKIALLEEQVDRLQRCKTREGANLEYLKNVIISYMVSKDVDGKRHMMNAISAVLQFTPSEMQVINNSFHKK